MAIRRASQSRTVVGSGVKTLTLPQLCSGRLLSQTDGPNAFISVSTSATPNAAGAWAQVFASTAGESGMVLFGCAAGGTAVDSSLMFDIGVGAAGSEVVVVPNIAHGLNNLFSANIIFPIPVRIPSGSRVAVRARTAAGAVRSVSPVMGILGHPESSLIPSSVDALGSSSATSRGTALSGASGSYVEIVSATTRTYQALVVIPAGATNVGINSRFRLTLGIGPAGQEVDIGTTDALQGSSGGVQPQTSAFNTPWNVFGTIVPAGSRIALRHNVASNPQYVEACVIGVPFP